MQKQTRVFIQKFNSYWQREWLVIDTKILILYPYSWTKNIYKMCSQLLLVDKKLEEAHHVMTQAGSDIERYDHGGQPALKEALKVFFLVLQVSHFLMAGQVHV